MKNEWLITFRSVTYAQWGERVLQRAKISCRLQRTPKHLTQRGCSYCLRIRERDVGEVLELFNREHLPYEKSYVVKEDGSTQEYAL